MTVLRTGVPRTDSGPDDRRAGPDDPAGQDPGVADRSDDAGELA